jgi:hypothetical protein
MSDAEIVTETEPYQLPPPGEAHRAFLRAILNAGNTCFVDAGDRIVAGTPSKPGALICTALEMLDLVLHQLAAGERGILIATRAGRRFAETGERVMDENITLDDVDLAWWGRDEIDYLTAEVLEGCDRCFARVVTTRREALDLLLAEGVITAAEARPDVDAWHAARYRPAGTN